MLGYIYSNFKSCKGTFFALMGVLFFANCFIFVPYFAGSEVYTAAKSSEGSSFLFMMCIFTVALSFYVGGIVQEGLLAADERKKWAYFVVSTEDGIKKQVGSKYILMLLYSVTISFVCIFMNALTADILGEDVPPTSGLILLLFFVQLLIRAINAPFIFAFSSKYGNTVRLAALLIVSAIALVYGLFGDLSIINMDTMWKKLFKAIEKLSESETAIWAQTAFFGVVIVLYFLSYKLSCKFYLKGAEHYDK
ncbi:ABC-2 transporter permease [Ruminococcus sp.]|uniref:ABC-2 transporter permease n=1 Tax=Ruminococcus sp. TaxID=41978 RepID=UPI0025CE6F5D|nr:ABC-2 transporter permease [Ruminococcus sp.]MBQ8966488.1 ABC-2 transporter permease [Ruminococcus sp.]